MPTKKTSDAGRYTKPDARERIKEKVKSGDKGGDPGQWSARKAQLLATEYEKEGGGYKKPLGEQQKSLKKWGAKNSSAPARKKAVKKKSAARKK